MCRLPRIVENNLFFHYSSGREGGEGAQNVPKGFWLQKFTLLQCKLLSKDSNLKGHSSSRAAKVFQMLSGALLERVGLHPGLTVSLPREESMHM